MNCFISSYLTSSFDSSLYSSTSASTSTDSTLFSIDPAQPDSLVQARSSVSDWDRIRSIGDGASSRVLLVSNRSTETTAALKIISKRGGAERAVLRERRIHATLTQSMRRWIVPLQASFHDSRNFYLAMDYVPGGDLAHEIIRCGSFQKQRAQIYCAELVIMLEQLHSQHVIHRDLKPANVLIRENGHLALADFGLSCDFNYRSRCLKPHCLNSDISESMYTTSEYTGTPYYMSPEQHRAMVYSFDADWWALGVTLYLMLTGRLPFAEAAETPAEIAFSVALEPVIFEKQDQVDQASQDLIRSLLIKDRHKRLSNASKIKDHPFFSDVDWNQVASQSYVHQWIPLVQPVRKPRIRGLGDLSIGTDFITKHDPYPSFSWTATSPSDHASAGRTIQTCRKAIKSVGRLVKIASGGHFGALR